MAPSPHESSPFTPHPLLNSLYIPVPASPSPRLLRTCCSPTHLSQRELLSKDYSGCIHPSACMDRLKPQVRVSAAAQGHTDRQTDRPFPPSTLTCCKPTSEASWKVVETSAAPGSLLGRAFTVRAQCASCLIPDPGSDPRSLMLQNSSSTSAFAQL